MDTKRLDKFYPQEERDTNPDYISGLAVTRFMEQLGVRVRHDFRGASFECSNKKEALLVKELSKMQLGPTKMSLLMTGSTSPTLRTLAKLAAKTHPGRGVRLKIVVEVEPLPPLSDNSQT